VKLGMNTDHNHAYTLCMKWRL